ncbi:primosomal protein N' [Streptococcus moroccensis]|uniref:primosomal protein N' n=1 Tax=Streptococcus moroccensis TaxID=1451356 RepID=UPI0027D8B3D4|nr:primosomal protein N' [Streptococcus moroccensis]
MMIAKLVVDVPLMQTDQPYSYRVPKEFETILAPGMRVHVPFGKANRLVQGIVLSVDHTKEAEGLKDIIEILDVRPVLNREQLALADQMRETVFSYKISILKAMLPNLLNSSYDKFLRPTDRLTADERADLFGSANQIRFTDLNPSNQAKVLRLAQDEKILVEYVATDKQTIKTEAWYEVNEGALLHYNPGNRAKKRQELKAFLTTHPEPGKLGTLRQEYSSSVVKYFLDNAFITEIQKEVSRSQGYFENVSKEQPLRLNTEQGQAVEAITESMGEAAKTFLLQGITGSGKTEVYLQVIEQALQKGKTAIMLVPEISLTPQVTHRFISRFGEQVAILHSGLSDGEKYDEWRKIEAGQAKVVVGARSAIFAPLHHIGAIIIDEEHESSYKQDSHPRYHARDVALLRAKFNQASLVLGSATPSLETRARAGKGVYQRLVLSHRANPLAQVPVVQVVDFRDYIGDTEGGNFTSYLLDKIQEKLSRKEQVVLLLNRRGYSSFVMCRDCGTVDQCPNCDISLTLHMDTKRMHCHYCGFTKAIPNVCPNCQSKSIRYYGTGTQKAVDELQELLPEARILRMDVDTTRGKGAHEKLLDAFGRQEADILLGTQMIAKGLDFPNVTLVGVLNADTALHLPDFRASERTFQLLTQVAGRAGRADKAGEVVIQTYNPDHYAIRFAKDQDYEGFYAYEMKLRHQLLYPPYVYTIAVTLSHRDESFVVKQAYEVMSLLRGQLSDQVVILGPTPKPIARTHNLFHYQIIVKYRFEEQLSQVMNRVLDFSQERDNKNLKLSIDHEPQHVM